MYVVLFIKSTNPKTNFKFLFLKMVVSKQLKFPALYCQLFFYSEIENEKHQRRYCFNLRPCNTIMTLCVTLSLLLHVLKHTATLTVSWICHKR